MTEQTPPVQSAAPEASPTPAPAPAPAPTPEAASEGQRPAWLPEKFADAEQLAKAYSELEKRLGSKEPPAPAPDAANPPRTEPTPEEALAVQRAGLDGNALAEEFLSSGTVSEESYKRAEAIGLTKEFVDNYVAGQAALVQRQEAELYSEVGGRDEFQRVAAWAKGNLSPREIQALDNATQNQDLALAKIALRGLYARYQAAVGQDPTLVSGDAGSAEAGFQSTAQVLQAMKDPRYDTDPAYRAQVEKRLQAKSPFTVRAVG
jgi:hypothetical protein